MSSLRRLAHLTLGRRIMKTTRTLGFLGALLFGLGIGCGDASSSLGTDVMAITGGRLGGEQLALPDGDGPGARDHAGPSHRLELDDLVSLLGLSAEQVAQLQPILDATRTAAEEIRAQVRAGTVSKEEGCQKIKALRDAQKTQIMALLTAEQQAKFGTMRQHHHGPFDPSKLKEVLGLSDDQVSQVTAIQAASQSKISDLHAQVEAGTLSADAARTQIEQIKQDTMAQVKAVLTTEQQAELDKLLSHHRPGRRHRH